MMRIKELRRYQTPLLAIFSFLLGWMASTNLVSLEKTCKIEDTDREYNIMRNSKLKNPELIVLILSAPRNLDRRTTIRGTWLQLIPDLSIRHENEINVKHYFVIGSFGLTTDDILHLSSEQSKFNDLLILPMNDSYGNLTLKVLKSFEWLNEQIDFGLGFKYVLKCDDDSFVKINLIAKELKKIENTYLLNNLDKNNLKTLQYLSVNYQINNENENRSLPELYWGYFNGNARIKTKGKWKETDWIICDRYVNYALGGGYIISKNLVRYLANNSQYLRRFNSEDISVGAWLSVVNNILRIHDVRFDTEWTTRGCKEFYLISHNISMTNMTKMYTRFKELNRMCEVEQINRKMYYYDWSKPPSQCCSV